MSLRLAGYVIIGSSTPGEDPVTVGYVWMDSGTNKLKICTSVSPYTWVEVTGAGGASAWGAITGTLSDQTDLQTALDNKSNTTHTHVESDVAGLVNDIATLVAADATKAPLVHATRHQSGGADPIALDTLDTPTDIATLNASTSAHGLMQKYPNTPDVVLSGSGQFRSDFYKDSGSPSWSWTSYGGFNAFSVVQANGTLASPRRTKSADLFLLFSAFGYNAADDVSVAVNDTSASASIVLQSTAAHTATSWPGKIVFKTIPAGSTSPLTRWTIGDDGGLTATAPAYLNVKLDDLIAPDDNTDTNASTSAHGLMQKYPGGTTTFLRADGSFTAPTAVPPVLVGPTNLVSTVEVIAANTFVYVGRQLEITSTGSIEIPSTSTLEISH